MRDTALLYVFSTPLDLIPLPFGSATTLAGLVFLFVWAIASLRGEVSVPGGGLLLSVFGALITWSFATASWSYAPSKSITQSVSTLLLVLSAIAISGVLRDSIAPSAIALALGSAVAGLAAIASGPDGTAGVEQATFLGIDQNALAFHIVLGLAAALFILLRTRVPRTRSFLLLIVLVQSASLMVVGSRTGIGSALALGLAAAVISMGSLQRTLRALRLLTAVVLVIWWFSSRGLVPTRVLEWLENPVTTDSRGQIIEAFRNTQDEWVFKGIGTAADADYLFATTSRYKNAHSAFWKVWIELGAVGLALWASMLVLLAHRSWRATDKTFFGLAAIPIFLFFYTLGPLNSNMLWVVFGLAIGAGAAGAAAQRNPS